LRRQSREYRAAVQALKQSRAEQIEEWVSKKAASATAAASRGPLHASVDAKLQTLC